MSMIGIVHSGITVKDLSISIPFYRDVLGLELIKQEPLKLPGVRSWGFPEQKSGLLFLAYQTAKRRWN